MAHRRDFLKLFGVTAAAIPAVSVAGETVEIHKDPSVEPLGNLAKRYEDHFDVQRAQLYSALEITGGRPRSQFRFFDYGLGTVLDWKRGNATIADTNMSRAGCLCVPESFLVENVGVTFSPASDAKERSRFIEASVLTVWLQQKAYWRAPVASLFSVGERRKASQINPEFPVSAIATLDIPLILHPDMYFAVEIDAPKFYPEMPLRMWAVLEGKHARAFQ